MSLLNNKLSTSILLVMGFSLPLLAQAKAPVVENTPAGENTVVEDCILPAEIEAMTDEQRAKITLPVCIDNADFEKDNAAQEPVIVK